MDILYWLGIFSFKKKYSDQDYWYFYSHTYNEIVHGLIQVGSSINLSFRNFFVLVRIDKILRPRLALNGSFFNIPKVCMCGHTFQNFMLSQPLSLYKKDNLYPNFWRYSLRFVMEDNVHQCLPQLSLYSVHQDFRNGLRLL